MRRTALVVATCVAILPAKTWSSEIDALDKVVESIQAVCNSPGQYAKHWKISGSGDVEGGVRIRLLGLAKGDIELQVTEEEWEGAQRVLQEHQASDNVNYRACVRELMPLLITKPVAPDDNVKRETSADPRKELANLGVAWSDDNFLEAVSLGDNRTAALFLEGGMPMRTARNKGRPLPTMLSKNRENPGKMLALLIRHGLDVNYVFETGNISGPQTTTLLTWAIENENLPLVDALAQSGADLDKAVQAYGMLGMATGETPLTLATRRGHWKVVLKLLDRGADPSAYDYAAHKGAMSRGEAADDQDARKAIKRLAPPR